jgi:FKBP-type peptidyl-prolyl cis-trans isomerase SlyD
MIAKGSTVRMNYTLSVDGHVVDSSQGREPLSFVQGAGEIIPGLEEQIQNLNPGAKTKIHLKPENGYGLPDPGAFQSFPRAAFDDPDSLQIGGVVQGQSGQHSFRATITEINDANVTLDLNHPLAGKALEFDIEILDVTPPASGLILP